MLKNQNIFIKVSEVEKRLFFDLAKRENMQMSTYVRHLITKEAKRAGLWPVGIKGDNGNGQPKPTG